LTVSVGRVASIDELLDRAVAAINRGDRVAASALADQVLAVDGGNAEAEDLLTAPGDAGEIRRLTIVFADLVDSTVLSTRVEPETYRMLVGRYRDQVQRSRTFIWPRTGPPIPLMERCRQFAPSPHSLLGTAARTGSCAPIRHQSACQLAP
jgi:hypothetical protein